MTPTRKNQVPVFLLFSYVIMFSTQGLAQNYLRGLLLDEDTRKPVAKAALFIIGGDRDDLTTDDGEFQLDLGTKYEPGDHLEIEVEHQEYGQQTVEMIIPKSMVYHIRIKKPVRTGLTGMVRDAQTRRPLQGIKVSLHPISISSNLKPIQTKTDENGLFRLTFPLDGIKDLTSARVYFRGPNDCYFYDEELTIPANKEFSLERNCPDPRPKEDRKQKADTFKSVSETTINSKSIILGNGKKYSLNSNQTVSIVGHIDGFNDKKIYWLGLYNKTNGLFMPFEQLYGSEIKTSKRIPGESDFVNKSAIEIITIEVDQDKRQLLRDWSIQDNVGRSRDFFSPAQVILISQVFITN